MEFGLLAKCRMGNKNLHLETLVIHSKNQEEKPLEKYNLASDPQWFTNPKNSWKLVALRLQKSQAVKEVF